MSWFQYASARSKLLLSFFAVGLVMAGVCAFSLHKMSSINAELNDLYENELVGLSRCKEANITLLNIGRATRNVVIEEDDAEMQAIHGRIHSFADIFRTNLGEVSTAVSTADGEALIARIEEAFPDYMAEVEQCVKLSLAGKNAEAVRVMKSGRLKADKLDEDMTALSKLKEVLAENAYHASDRAYGVAFWIVLTVTVVGVLGGMLLGWFIARWFTNSLLEVNLIAKSLASASQQLAAAAEQLSGGAQQQACSLEETAVSLEQITGTIQNNAENAQQANQLATGSRDVAEKGRTVTERAVSGMSDINASSKKIADIITTIDEIAFQTNLLALNAAVEAARAGEQGRGFAVVAGEVRNLAQRSAGAAKEIKSLIQDSVSKVELGAELVNESGATLDDIVTSVNRVTNLMGEIAAASREQASGIELVNRAVTQMDQVTQVNASQTEELSTTAEALAAQAEDLQVVVSRFNLSKKLGNTAVARRSNPAKSIAASSQQPGHWRQNGGPPQQCSHDLEDHVAHELNTIGADASEFAGFEEF